MLGALETIEGVKKEHDLATLRKAALLKFKLVDRVLTSSLTKRFRLRPWLV